jgi:hypothetical protein
MGRTLPGPDEYQNSCLDHREGVDSSHMAKKRHPHLTRGTMDHALTSRRHQSNLKKTIVKLFFLFHLGNGMFIINVTQRTFPLTVEFNACQILPGRDLTSQLQLQGYYFYLSPILGSTGKLGICPEWMDVA